jgi:hypothetical protein
MWKKSSGKSQEAKGAEDITGFLFGESERNIVANEAQLRS